MVTTTKRPISTHAAVAKAIRVELKTAYPHTTFSVRANGAVDVAWTDGPTESQVREITGKYQRGHFDGMTDSYVDANVNDDVPQVRYVFCHRSMSLETQRQLCDILNRMWGTHLEIGDDRCPVLGTDVFVMGYGWASERIWQTFVSLSLVCNRCKIPTFAGDAYCGECGCRLNG